MFLLLRPGPGGRVRRPTAGRRAGTRGAVLKGLLPPSLSLHGLPCTRPRIVHLGACPANGAPRACPHSLASAARPVPAHGTGKCACLASGAPRPVRVQGPAAGLAPRVESRADFSVQSVFL